VATQIIKKNRGKITATSGNGAMLGKKKTRRDQKEEAPIPLKKKKTITRGENFIQCRGENKFIPKAHIEQRKAIKKRGKKRVAQRG